MTMEIRKQRSDDVTVPKDRLRRTGPRGMSMLATLALAALILPACASGSKNGSGSSSGAAHAQGGTLTVAALTPPTSLNPILNAGSSPSQWYSSLAYDSLIKLGPNGELEPGLATSWKYVGVGDKTFELSLRPGVKFSDGTPLTAAAVVTFLEAFKKSNYAPYVKDMASITATGPLTVQITGPGTSIFPDLFSGNGNSAGQIVSPTALANPNSLSSQTDGAGEYMLDASASIPNSKYVYVPNPYYYDKAAVHWHSVVITVITDPNTTLAALESGQDEVAEGDVSTAAAAKAAGLQVQTGPDGLEMLMVTDPGGKLVPALGSTAVRQALSDAIDRPAIAKALYGSYGSTSQSPQAPGTPGYAPAVDHYYTYDLNKAKQLLATAGYPNGGFTVSVLVSGAHPETKLMCEAIAADWAKLGVTLNVVAPPSSAARADLALHKWGLFAVVIPYGNPIMATELWFESPGGLINYFNYPFPDLSAQIAKAKTQAPGPALTSTLAQINTTIIQQAYEIPGVTAPFLMFHTNKVTGITIPGDTPGPNPIYWQPAS